MQQQEESKTTRETPSAEPRTSNRPAPPVPGLLKGAWELQYELSDDFDGDALDGNKWINYNPEWDGRAPGFFKPDNVSIGDDVATSDRCLQLTNEVDLAGPPQPEPEGCTCDCSAFGGSGRTGSYRRFDDDNGDSDDECSEIEEYTISTAFVRSQKMVKYGYFEAKVQAADSITSSAFWLVHKSYVSDQNSPYNKNEIDVFELSTAKERCEQHQLPDDEIPDELPLPDCPNCVDNEKEFHSNAHEWVKDGDEVKIHHSDTVELDFPVCTPFTVGLLWDEDKLEWYINGQQVRRLENNGAWTDYMYVQFDTEVQCANFGIPIVIGEEGQKLPSTFKVFYFHAWQKVE